MSRRRLLLGLVFTVSWWFGCIQAESPQRMSRPQLGDAEDAGEPFDAGAIAPPSGHVPDGSYCDQLRDLEALAGRGAIDVRDGAAGRAAHATGTGAGAGSGVDSASAGMGGIASGTDAGPLVPSPALAGAMIVTEFLADPDAHTDTDGEWIELYNPGTDALALAGCTLGREPSSAKPLDGTIVVEPSAYVTVARTTSPGFAPTTVLAISLTNSADSIVLTCDGIEIDRVDYDRKQGFPLAAGVSSARDAAGAWCLATSPFGGDLGTPGEPNPPCSASDASLP